MSTPDPWVPAPATPTTEAGRELLDTLAPIKADPLLGIDAVRRAALNRRSRFTGDILAIETEAHASAGPQLRQAVERLIVAINRHLEPHGLTEVEWREILAAAGSPVEHAETVAVPCFSGRPASSSPGRRTEMTIDQPEAQPETAAGRSVTRWHVEAAAERIDDMIDSLRVTGEEPSGLTDVASLLCDALDGKPAGLTARGYTPPFQGTLIVGADAARAEGAAEGAARYREALRDLHVAFDDYVWLISPRDAQGNCRLCDATEGLSHDPAKECGRLAAADMAAGLLLAALPEASEPGIAVDLLATVLHNFGYDFPGDRPQRIADAYLAARLATEPTDDLETET